MYATYLDARRRFADLKAARGFWPVMAVPPSTSGTSTTPTSSCAPSKGKPTKGKGKGGKSKGKGGQRPFTFRRDLHHNERLLLQCAYNVASLAITVMHAQIHLRRHLHRVAHNPLSRRPRPPNPMPTWFTPMWMLAITELFAELWIMELAAS